MTTVDVIHSIVIGIIIGTSVAWLSYVRTKLRLQRDRCSELEAKVRRLEEANYWRMMREDAEYWRERKEGGKK